MILNFAVKVLYFMFSRVKIIHSSTLKFGIKIYVNKKGKSRITLILPLSPRTQNLLLYSKKKRKFNAYIRSLFWAWHRYNHLISHASISMTRMGGFFFVEKCCLVSNLWHNRMEEPA